jgi:3-methyladenine DNA glycosylase/8-oxoguanine DNA glycosylase
MVVGDWVSITISSTGPIDLKKTLESGHSSFPIPVIDKKNRYYLVIFEPKSKKYVITRVYQKGAKIGVDLYSTPTPLKENNIKEMRKIIRIILGLNINLEEFYTIFKKDPIAPAFKERTGVRLTRAHNLFESLICSLITQRNSVWKWNAQARKISELMGVRFPVEHFNIYSFPDAKQVYRNKHLLKDARLGYREEYVIAATEYIANYQVRLEKLLPLSTMDAKKTLLKFKGIGQKVADMFLLYGLGKSDVPPTDVWIQRGVSKYFFKGKEKTLEECRDKLADHYGKWAGLAQLYMYDWMRNIIGNEKK